MPGNIGAAARAMANRSGCVPMPLDAPSNTWFCRLLDRSSFAVLLDIVPVGGAPDKGPQARLGDRHFLVDGSQPRALGIEDGIDQVGGGQSFLERLGGCRTAKSSNREEGHEERSPAPQPPGLCRAGRPVASVDDLEHSHSPAVSGAPPPLRQESDLCSLSRDSKNSKRCGNKTIAWGKKRDARR